MQQSSTLLILSKDLKIFWLHRGDSAPFLPAYHCFAGGALKGQEANDQNLRHLSLLKAQKEIKYPFTTHRIDKWISLGSWFTHPYLHTQMETHFYLDFLDNIDAQDLALEYDQQHFQGGHWIKPIDALKHWETSKILIAPPTYFYIKQLTTLIQEIPNLQYKSLTPYVINDFFLNHPLKTRLQSVNPIRPNIQVFPLKTPTLPPATHTNCYIVGKKKLLIVDPGATIWQELQRLFDELSYRINEGLAQGVDTEVFGIFLTHHHVDHISGVIETQKYLSQKYQRHIPVYAHLNTAKEVDFPVDIFLEEGPWHIDDPFTDLELLHTPGHAKGHLCLWEKISHTAIVGDMVAGTGTILIDPYEGDMKEYLAQLSRLKTYSFSALLPSHGAPIATANLYLQSYIDHRLNREQKVLNALSFEKRRSLSRIVDIAYHNTAPNLRKGPNGGIAGLSAFAHLLKLQKDGLVRCEQEQWIRIAGPENETEAGVFQKDNDSWEYEQRLSTLIKELTSMMAVLRADCDWNQKQDLPSLKRYLLEEAYELYEVMDRESIYEIGQHKIELGDLFLQILFQSQIRKEQKDFDLVDVLLTLKEKMIRRHPHVFYLRPKKEEEQAKLSLDEIRSQYLEIKRKESLKHLDDQGVKDENAIISQSFTHIPSAMPPLLKAMVIGEKAANARFDWLHWQDSFQKITEESNEILEAIRMGDAQEIEKEIGDLLFAVVNLCRHLKVDPHLALQRTNEKFMARFQEMLALCSAQKIVFSALRLDQMEELWQKSKTKAP